MCVCLYICLYVCLSAIPIERGSSRIGFKCIPEVVGPGGAGQGELIPPKLENQQDREKSGGASGARVRFPGSATFYRTRDLITGTGTYEVFNRHFNEKFLT